EWILDRRHQVLLAGVVVREGGLQPRRVDNLGQPRGERRIVPEYDLVALRVDDPRQEDATTRPGGPNIVFVVLRRPVRVCRDVRIGGQLTENCPTLRISRVLSGREIGRASCRERVRSSGVAAPVEK